MDLEQHYHQMWTHAVRQFTVGNFEYDSLTDAGSNDQRRGITLLARPSETVKEAVGKMLRDLHTSEPQQYYYPVTDIHVTVLSIISCYAGFSLSLIDIEAYKALVQKVLKNHKSFKVTFSGLTASPGSLIIQGFPEDDTLNDIRNTLRRRFRNSELQHSIDKRYAIQTAHSTVVRFKEPLADSETFLRKAKKYKEVDFGTFEVNELELVFNDWYQKAENTVVLAKYCLEE
ncbi:2'-5' RNA ligase family protein [Runella sp.]|uniref:2'-5' RNA ligase family protein n=1 Tax=Runella sp. TaxID=1960881 RepID=UPI003D115E3C